MHDVIDLPIERVNALSPYKVYINNNGSLGFETQYGSVYEVVVPVVEAAFAVIFSENDRFIGSFHYPVV